MAKNKIIQVEDKVPFRLMVPLSIQHMFAMFGASVLVPTILGINPAIVLLMNGIGTLMFIFITKGKAPAYLGSSFAFLASGSLSLRNTGSNMRWAASLWSVSAGASCLSSSINSARSGSISFCRLRLWGRWLL